MGQSELCRAQLAIWSSVVLVHVSHVARCLIASSSSLRKQDSTYSAYCMAPFFPSWLGSGTSRRACFIGGGVPGPPETNPGFWVVVALFEEVLERNATLPARYGSSAIVGLAVHTVSY